MSINYCTIGRDRIDGFCGNQRAKVLARLIHEAGHDIIVVPPVNPPRHSGGGGISIGAPGFNFTPNVLQPGIQRPWQQQPQPKVDLEKDAPPREQPFITVKVEFMGLVGSQTIEASNRLDFVVVSDLEINDGPEITVNISEMEI